MKKGYILVFTTSSAFEAEMLLKAANFSVKLVPTPREFSSDCGIAVEFNADSDDIGRICEILNNAKIEYEVKLI